MDAVVYSPDSLFERCRGLTEVDAAFLKAVTTQIPIVADVSRADILLYGQLEPGWAISLAHARPHSISPVHPHSLSGHKFNADQEPLVLVALASGRPQQGGERPIADGAPVIKQVYPLRRLGGGKVVGAFSVETNLLEHERHRRRHREFQQALLRLQMMAQRAQLVGVEDVSPFEEHDGIIVVDRERTIRYASGIATNLYRRIGYSRGLLGHRLSDLESGDDELVRAAVRQFRCLEQEEEAGGRYWVKKAVPLLDLPGSSFLARFKRERRADEPSHTLLMVRDSTESRRREQELRVKTAMIQEVHHRVKNNLQTIAALLRMQARRMDGQQARAAVDEAITRILSVAVIHEFLSHQDSRVINIRDVGNRILTQLRHEMLGPDSNIRFDLQGPPIFLPARQATACALVMNELLQNAVEHGFKEGSVGHVKLTLQDEGDKVIVRVQDDGGGLPTGFSIEHADSLGLQIVQTLVREDLKGTIQMHNGGGAEAIVTFPKPIFGGEEDWTAHV